MVLANLLQSKNQLEFELELEGSNPKRKLESKHNSQDCKNVTRGNPNKLGIMAFHNHIIGSAKTNDCKLFPSIVPSKLMSGRRMKPNEFNKSTNTSFIAKTFLPIWVRAC